LCVTAVGKVARREIAVHGITRLDQLTSLTAPDLLQIHGVGPKSVRVVAEELDARGLRFAAQQCPFEDRNRSERPANR
jgi:predicted flap endonuclease-1-like 5' DNA nuclease